MSKLNEVLDRAKSSLNKTKTAANAVTAKNGTDKVIPGFSDYAINAAGEVVSRKTGKQQQIPKGKKKFLIYNDKGERKSISLDEIKEKTKSIAPAKATKQPGEKGATKKAKIIQLHNEGKTGKEIAELTGFKYNSVYIMLRGHITLTLFEKLNKPGGSKTDIIKQIIDKTGYSKDYIEWRISN